MPKVESTLLFNYALRSNAITDHHLRYSSCKPSCCFWVLGSELDLVFSFSFNASPDPTVFSDWSYCSKVASSSISISNLMSYNENPHAHHPSPVLQNGDHPPIQDIRWALSHHLRSAPRKSQYSSTVSLCEVLLAPVYQGEHRSSQSEHEM